VSTRQAEFWSSTLDFRGVGGPAKSVCDHNYTTLANEQGPASWSFVPPDSMHAVAVGASGRRSSSCHAAQVYGVDAARAVSGHLLKRQQHSAQQQRVPAAVRRGGGTEESIPCRELFG
jgi:hypothetical protein